LNKVTLDDFARAAGALSRQGIARALSCQPPFGTRRRGGGGPLGGFAFDCGAWFR
jgi:hypothetical protein